jgi:hypothetical protein
MRLPTFAIGLGLAVMLTSALLWSPPAGSIPPTGYGFDDAAHVIVGGGGSTASKAALHITDLWDQSPGCPTTNLNTCVSNANPETNTLGNYQHDSVTVASPIGGVWGVRSLNGVQSYAGTVRQSSPDFALTGRGPASTDPYDGNELASDTFWGFGMDGIELMGFNNHGTDLMNASGSALTWNEIYGIYNCSITTWSQIPELNIAPNSAQDGPIVPWGNNPASDEYVLLEQAIRANVGGAANFVLANQPCVRNLSSGQAPNPNDVKPLINDPSTLSTLNTSRDNPENWVWFGAFGSLSSHPNDSSTARGGTTFNSYPAVIEGVPPSTPTILSLSYPLGHVVYLVTRKSDADCPKTGGSCDFLGNPGPALPGGSGNDLNVTGGTSGAQGAVRELVRFVCRTSAQQATNPDTGTNYFTHVNAAVSQEGMTVVASSLRASGSRCQVLS